MKSAAKPSPLPWSSDDDVPDRLAVVGRDKNVAIAYCTEYKCSRKVGEANRDLIVRAVNAHKVMAARLRDRIDECLCKDAHSSEAMIYGRGLCPSCTLDRNALRAGGEAI